MEDSLGPSLCLFGAVFPMLLAFGSDAAERTMQAEWRVFQNAHQLPVEAWHIAALPRALATSRPVPDGAIRHERRHYAFDISFLGADR